MRVCLLLKSPLHAFDRASVLLSCPQLSHSQWKKLSNDKLIRAYQLCNIILPKFVAYVSRHSITVTASSVVIATTAQQLNSLGVTTQLQIQPGPVPPTLSHNSKLSPACVGCVQASSLLECSRMSSHLIDTSDEENCVVALTLFISDLLDEGQVIKSLPYSSA